MIFDPNYFIMVMIPGLILGGIATWITKSTFKRYAKVGVSSRMTGAQAARQLLNSQGLQNVNIEAVNGFLSDHYDPRHRVLRLSPDVYQGQSLSAIGVACHEAGHALQHAEHYAPLQARSALVPITQFGSQMSYIFILGGMFLQFPGLILFGAILFSFAVLFSLVTLPVEWDASARAKRYMVSSGIVTQQESEGAAKVLNAAFLTYVAAAVTSILTLLYYLMRAGVFGNRD